LSMSNSTSDVAMDEVGFRTKGSSEEGRKVWTSSSGAGPGKQKRGDTGGPVTGEKRSVRAKVLKKGSEEEKGGRMSTALEG